MARMTALATLAATTLLVGVGLTTAAEATSPSATTAQQAVVFGGNGLKVKLNHHPAGLSRTSPSFRRFLDRELKELWGWDDQAPECRNAPAVYVQEFRRNVAYLNEGVYAVPVHAACAQGGNWQFAIKREGRWVSPRAIGGQDVPSCRRLRTWDIPRMTGAEKCYDGTSVVDYQP